ncbi:GNAT family N-acetyltransferase [Roseibacterium beibuensis]|uniref:GNAT family N-acetyltransferase n=1 Tax=[Roseibacterium] beibuensis TaxID=1193142 RepID=A0ABP9KRQ3_9RHOB|nr:GNAT family N-acetyltransferase [Roseibacterium beibuensis]MCS6622422.1 GNAT family N-acetyltransferase [Roseibacterium beibuensis]
MTPEVMSALYSAAFPDSRPWTATEIAALLNRPTTHAITAPHGFALIQVIAPEAELLTIVIDPAQQGQGLGRALLDKTLDRAATLGASCLFLEVDMTNAPALALYGSAGFEQAGHRANYYVKPDGSRSDALLLCKALSAAA